MALELLKSVGAGKPYYGFKDLAIGNHKIELFRFVKNKNYDSKDPKSLPRVILVELADQILFLPEYFAAILEDDDEKINELNSDGIDKYLSFGGKRPSGK